MHWETNTRPHWLIMLMAIISGVLLLLAACGDDDDDAGNGDPAEQATETDAADNGDAPTDGDEPDNGGIDGGVAGTITVGDETWEFVPTIQCGNFFDVAGQIYISGVAASDESIEISIDHDDSLMEAKVRREQGIEQPYWVADESSGISFEVNGDVVAGSGTFINFLTQEEADGSWEITC
ncbi:MAG TPA: hypothetical protein VMR52_05605 [Dehalococcoidia bacterium]|nr:hypothetical protein [Dehalococcoidia bacterium]